MPNYETEKSLLNYLFAIFSHTDLPKIQPACNNIINYLAKLEIEKEVTSRDKPSMIFLIAKRGLGKTSLFLNIKFYLVSEIIPVYIDLLFAGIHLYNEIKNINWGDYIKKERIIPIGVLDFISALKLVINPIPECDIIYHSLILAKNLIYRLGQHPFLIQIVMFELTKNLNNKNRKIATHKLFISARSYFK